MEITVTTYNIQSCKDYITKNFDPKVIAKVINAIKPDILGLNEVRNSGVDEFFFDQPKTLSNLTNIKYNYFGKAINIANKGPYGNALLSKYELLDTKTIPIPDPLIKDEDAYYESRCFIKSKIKINNELINVLVVHVGLANSEQKNAINCLLQEIDSTIGKLIIMGDFNMTSDNELIKILQNKLFDTANLFTKDYLTFPSINPVKKIDYIFTRGLTVKAATVNEVVGSDHFPVTCVIEI